MKKLVLFLSIISLSVGCTKKDNTAEKKIPEIKDLLMQEVVVGSGTEAKDGNTVKVNYRGTFLDGKEFDSSYSRNQPFEFKLGTKQVIEGWDIGVRGMKVGGKRVLVIPPKMAYGEKGAGGVIPPNTPLKFEVELLAVDGKADAKPEKTDAKNDTKTETKKK